ncbi:hypothetical protein [Methylosinus sp. Sm6]|uniref:hypothetical protein n=1 Tax=Methylosinus sp. Sm6 TaxID=2866948 RepID=UPI001C995341|nr:hypothetical protein [Methylosinus sp. Sm6]MBY6241417.1 hypothetical protein [Methylosinus sp. Sm6]
MRKSTAMDIIGITAGALALLVLVQQANGETVKGPKTVVAQRFAVDLWWNVGGDMGGLKKATDSCVKKLGEGERPVRQSTPATTILSQAMLDCLEGEGWRPAGEPRPV